MGVTCMTVGAGKMGCTVQASLLTVTGPCNERFSFLANNHLLLPFFNFHVPFSSFPPPPTYPFSLNGVPLSLQQKLHLTFIQLICVSQTSFWYTITLPENSTIINHHHSYCGQWTTLFSLCPPASRGPGLKG